MRILKILFVTNHFGWTSGSPTNCYSLKRKSHLILDLVRMMAQSAPKRQRRMEQKTNKIFATQSLQRILSLVVDACVITSCRLVFALFCWAPLRARLSVATVVVTSTATVVVTSSRVVLALFRWTSGRRYFLQLRSSSHPFAWCWRLPAGPLAGHLCAAAVVITSCCLVSASLRWTDRLR